MDAITEATTKASSLDLPPPSSQRPEDSSLRSASLPQPGQPSPSSSVSGLVELTELQEEAGIAPSSPRTSPRQRAAAAAKRADGAAAAAPVAPPAVAGVLTQAAGGAPAVVNGSPFSQAAEEPVQQPKQQEQAAVVPATVVPPPQYVSDFSSFLKQMRAEQGLDPEPAAAADAAAAGETRQRGTMEADSFGPAGSAQMAEQVAAALNQLLSDIGDGLEKVGQRISKTAGKTAERAASTANKALSPLRFEAPRRGIGSSAAHPAEQQQQQQQQQQGSPSSFSAFQQPPSGFAAGAAVATTAAADGQQQAHGQQQEHRQQEQQGAERPHVERRRHEPVAAEPQQSLPSPHHLLAVHSTAHGTLPCSPFESMGGPAAEQPSIASNLIRGISQVPTHGSLEPPAGEEAAAAGLQSR